MYTELADPCGRMLKQIFYLQNNHFNFSLEQRRVNQIVSMVDFVKKENVNVPRVTLVNIVKLVSGS